MFAQNALHFEMYEDSKSKLFILFKHDVYCRVLKDICLQTPLFKSLGLVRIYQGYIYFIKNTVQIYIEK